MNKMSALEREELAEEIDRFLASHGKLDQEGEFNGPDSSMLDCFSKSLRAGAPFPNQIWSDWGSGCYQPFLSEDGQKWHDDLVNRCNNIIRSQL